MTLKHLFSILNVTRKEIEELFSLALDIEEHPSNYANSLGIARFKIDYYEIFRDIFYFIYLINLDMPNIKKRDFCQGLFYIPFKASLANFLSSSERPLAPSFKDFCSASLANIV